MMWPALGVAFVLGLAGVAAALWRRRRLIQAADAVAVEAAADPDGQRQARRAHELQAIGLVAAGIAHDFNNTLTVVLGSASMLRQAAERHPELLPDVESLTAAARRASALTRRLLALTRRESPGIERVRAAAIVESLAPLLRRLLPSGASLEFTDDTGGRDEVLCDPRSLELALVGLVGGARPAVASGGPLRLRCDTAERLDPATGVAGAVVRVTIEGPAAMLDGDAMGLWQIVTALPPDAPASARPTYQTVRLADGRAAVQLSLPVAATGDGDGAPTR